MTDEISTYIKEIDEIIGGGIPKNFSFLISGEPGTMKTSLASWILYQNIKEKNISTGFYILFDQGSTIYLEQIKGLGMDPNELPKGTFDIIPISIETDFLPNEQGRKLIAKLRDNEITNRDKSLIALILKTLGIKIEFDYNVTKIQDWKRFKSDFTNSILVIDSLSVLNDIGDLEKNRDLLLALMNKLKEIGFTTIYISEKNLINQYSPEKYLSDGIIILEHRDKVDMSSRAVRNKGGRYANSFTKTIKCEKMRTRNIDTGYYFFNFVDGKFKFSPFEYIPQ